MHEGESVRDAILEELNIKYVFDEAAVSKSTENNLEEIQNKTGGKVRGEKTN